MIIEQFEQINFFLKFSSLFSSSLNYSGLIVIIGSKSLFYKISFNVCLQTAI